MGLLKRLIQEIHRRSLWQVLAVYLAGSWVALQVVGELTRSVGLPEWVSPTALALLIVGLPIVLATAVVQEGAPVPGREARDAGGPASEPGPAEAEGPDPAPSRASHRPDTGSPASPPAPGSGPSFLERHLTWKRALLAGVAAFALLGMAVTGYFVMRVAGIGPAATLVAQGVIDEGGYIILADFENHTDDERMGPVVTGALRADLADSPILQLLPDRQVAQALGRMGRDPEIPLDGPLARELAVREGVKAVLEGEIGAAGSGYILTATLRTAEDGRSLASFRRTARGPDDVIDAIDALSRDIRERAGESLRTIRGGPPLSQVTTSSLSALQRYTEGERLFERGDELGAIALLEQAVELDPEFAMAWRKLAVALGNLGIQEERAREAAQRAWTLRDRLTEKERFLAEAYYHSQVTGDVNAERRAYEAVLHLDPNEVAALNNLALIYAQEDRLERAEELLRRILETPGGASVISYQNLIFNLTRQGRIEDAREVLADYGDEMPESAGVAAAAFWVHAFSGDLDTAERLTRSVAEDPDQPGPRRRLAMRNLGHALAAQGRTEEALDRYLEGALLARSALGPQAEYTDRLNRATVVGITTRDPDRVIPLMRELWTGDLMNEISPGAVQHIFHAVFHFSMDDAPGLREVLDHWEEQGDPEPPPGQRAQIAFFRFWLDEGRNDPEGLLRELERLEEATDCVRCYGDFRARFLEAAGRLDEALEEWQTLRTEPLPNRAWYLALLPTAHWKVGELGETVGDTARALNGYRAFIDLQENADPDLQPRVQAARERVAALSGPP